VQLNTIELGLTINQLSDRVIVEEVNRSVKPQFLGYDAIYRQKIACSITGELDLQHIYEVCKFLHKFRVKST
jgi:hypothetical protein